MPFDKYHQWIAIHGPIYYRWIAIDQWIDSADNQIEHSVGGFVERRIDIVFVGLFGWQDINIIDCYHILEELSIVWL